VLRQFAAQPDRSALWLAYHRSGQQRVAVARFNDETMRRWARAQELAGEDGRPLILHRSRIRVRRLADPPACQRVSPGGQPAS